MPGKLNVFLHHDLVGVLSQDEHGRIGFSYLQSWLQNQNAVPLSSSLPLAKVSFDANECRGFFSGVLPESESLEIIARNLGISSRNSFAVLDKIGGECAGAVTFLPSDATPEQAEHSYRALPSSELTRILKMLPKRPLLAGEDGVRLSLAGVQNKVPVFIRGDEIFLPIGNSPSSHILKPDPHTYPELVQNEAFCLNLARDVGLQASLAQAEVVDGINYLLVERYDRTRSADGDMIRIHQEDFCQALGIPPELKYQKEGGPSLKDCFSLLRLSSSVPVIDLNKMLNAVLFNFLIGNNDAHGKNFSLLRDGKRVVLAPLYDLVCTICYSELSGSMAMDIGGEYDAENVYPRHFEKLASEIGFSSRMIIERVLKFAVTLEEHLAQCKIGNSIEFKIKEVVTKRCLKIKERFK